MGKISLLCLLTAVLLLRGVYASDQEDEVECGCQSIEPVTSSVEKANPELEIVLDEKTLVKPEIVSESTECDLWVSNIYMDMNYGLLMADAMANKEYDNAMIYEDIKNQRNQYLGIKDNLSYDDLFLLSKVVDAEAGSSWLSDEHRLLVASVVINRVNSPEFPNTIYEVVYQDGQYAPVRKEWFDDILPSRDSVMAAYRILTEGSIAPSDVVYQANFQQGSGTYNSIYDSKLGTTYFCYSSKRHIYE